MKIAFRTDASLLMGSGHVMRCLTLADALKAKGAESHFISREHPGHLFDLIRQHGHAVTSLPAALPQPPVDIQDATSDPTQEPAHAPWLGCDWQTDAQQTCAILTTLQPDWLVVDHYALDQRWETALQPHFPKLMVIDDLADRPHHCDLLLDQNLGRQPQDYANLVPVACQVLTGPHYALLRPEFAALRDYSLKRRANSQLKQLLITMGGVDLPNATSQILASLKTCPLPADCRVTVVMGATAPWLAQVRKLAEQMLWPTDVMVNIHDMAQRMADSDLAIGAAGSTSWERCCLGLPTLMVVLADNQWLGARALHKAQAASLIGGVSEIAAQLPLAVQALTQDHQLIHLSTAASAVTDGRGVRKVLQAMESLMTKFTSKESLVRPMVHADLERVLIWRNHPEVRRYMYTQHEITLDEHQCWFERTLQDPRKHLLIFESSNQPLGFVNFTELVSGGIADWGFYAAPDVPKGSGRRLGRAALDHAFTNLKLHKVCAQVLAYNERSIHFHKSLGFQQEGTLRDQHFEGGRYHHVICFGLLSHEWQPNL